MTLFCLSDSWGMGFIAHRSLTYGYESKTPTVLVH